VADNSVKAALEADAGARAKTVKYNTLFSDSQEKAWKPKQLKRMLETLSSLERKKLNPYVLNERNLTQSPEPLQRGSSASRVTGGPTDSGTSGFVVTATFMTTLITARLQIRLMR
jgi:hypothetical protein